MDFEPPFFYPFSIELVPVVGVSQGPGLVHDADQGGPLVCCAEHLVIVGAAPGAALGNGAVKALAGGLGVVVDIFWAVCIVLC